MPYKSQEDIEKLYRQLDELGVEEVRNNLAKKIYSSGQRLEHVQNWLAIQESSKEEARLHRQEAREEESLSISRNALSISEEANSNSREANKLALRAIIWSAIATLIATIAIIFK